ncbi:MAG TPA: YdcF family protein [Nevskiaceae bacterium]|nr:YdcF family protein [Nevskiaceae bacterium]
MSEAYDAIVTLGAGVEADGRANAEARQRVAASVHQLQKGRAPYIIMSGNRPFRSSDTGLPPVAEAGRDYALDLGVETHQVVLEPTALDTIGEAVFVKQNITEPRGWRNLLVATTASHEPRAIRTFRHVMGGGYNIAGLSVGKFEQESLRQTMQEFAGSLLVRAVLGGTEPGDDETIKRRLFDIVPGYEPHSLAYRVGKLLRVSPHLIRHDL